MSDATAGIRKFARDIRRRNIIEIGVGLVMLVVFGRHAATAPAGSLELYGYLLLVAGLLFVIGMMLFVASTRGALRDHPAEDLVFWRAEIRRHARLLRFVPAWYLAPFLPGLVLLLWPLVRFFARAEAWVERVAVAVPVLMIAVIAIAVASLNKRAARQLETLAASISEAHESDCG